MQRLQPQTALAAKQTRPKIKGVEKMLSLKDAITNSQFRRQYGDGKVFGGSFYAIFIQDGVDIDKMRGNVKLMNLMGKREYNEDRAVVIIRQKYMCLFVLDGHGGDFVVQQLMYQLVNDFALLDMEAVSRDYQMFLTNYIFAINEKIKVSCGSNASFLGSGSTLAGVILYDVKVENEPPRQFLIMMNLGDSQIFTHSGDKSVKKINNDHQPNAKEEKMRLRLQGRTPTKEHGDDWRIEGLSVSRSIGDYDVDTVSSKFPEVSVMELGQENENICKVILTSDAILEFPKHKQMLVNDADSVLQQVKDRHEDNFTMLQVTW